MKTPKAPKVRKSWGSLKPATRVVPSKKRYRRPAEKARLIKEGLF